MHIPSNHSHHMQRNKLPTTFNMLTCKLRNYYVLPSSTLSITLLLSLRLAFLTCIVFWTMAFHEFAPADHIQRGSNCQACPCEHWGMRLAVLKE